MLLNQIIRRDIQRQTHALPLFFRFLPNAAAVHGNPSEKVALEGSLDSQREQNVGSRPKEGMKTPIEENPFYAKYADKIRERRLREQQEGQKKELQPTKEPTPDLSQSGDEQIRKNNESVEVEAPLGKPVGYSDLRKPISAQLKEDMSAKRRSKRLDDVVNVSLLLQHDKDEIEQIWNEYHRNRPGYLFAVIPSGTYQPISENGRKYPMFIYPIPKEDVISKDGEAGISSSGYQLFLGQFNNNEVHFTPLIMYHMYQENAPPILSLRHYPELSEQKGIVLMQGQYDDKILQPAEAQCLVNQMQLYYSGQDPSKTNLLHGFNMEPQNFDYTQVIKALEF